MRSYSSFSCHREKIFVSFFITSSVTEKPSFKIQLTPTRKNPKKSFQQSRINFKIESFSCELIGLNILQNILRRRP